MNKPNKTSPLDSFRLRVSLKQHTSLIVADEEREFFLRGTELRPKLNTFLKKQIEGTIPEEWLIGEKEDFDDSQSSDLTDLTEESRALNFRLADMIYCEVMEVFERDKIMRRFEINTRLQEDRKVTLMGATFYRRWGADNSTSFTLHCKIPKLMGFIRKHLPEFFIQSNFGRAQSKGYGQFTVASINSEPERCSKTVEQCLRNIAYDKSTIYQYRLNSTNVTEDIKYLYTWLKKGINFKDDYKKSLLFEYFCKNYPDKEQPNFPGWEKRAMKKWMCNEDESFFKESVLFNPKNSKFNRNESCDSSPKRESKIEDHLFIRALLGLPENFQFMMRGTDYKKTTLHVNDSKGEIEQFPSTVQIKLFQQEDGVYKIFLIPKEVKLLLNEVFELTASVKQKEDKDPPKFAGKSFSIKTPDSFDLIDFLDFACEAINKESDKEIKLLKKIEL